MARKRPKGAGPAKAGTEKGDTPLFAASLLGALGMQVRGLRDQRGLTAREVAERAGISLRFYSQLEAGRANIAIGRLAGVAGALGTSLSALLAAVEGALAARTPRAIALLGMRGAGKSTVGRALAARLQVPFVELDERIEQEAGLSITELFNLHGEPYYRRLETRCLEGALAGGGAAVLALPGGIVTNPEAFELARARATTVWLRATPEEHMSRVLAQGDHRPMANRPDAMTELRAILRAREPLYRRADRVLETSRASVPALVETLAAELGAG